METQKTSNSQSNLDKEEWNWRNQPAWLQALLQSHSHQGSMVLAQKYRPMEQNRKPRDKPIHLRTPYLWQRRQEYTKKGLLKSSRSSSFLLFRLKENSKFVTLRGRWKVESEEIESEMTKNSQIRNYFLSRQAEFSKRPRIGEFCTRFHWNCTKPIKHFSWLIFFFLSCFLIKNMGLSFLCWDTLGHLCTGGVFRGCGQLYGTGGTPRLCVHISGERGYRGWRVRT